MAKWKDGDDPTDHPKVKRTLQAHESEFLKRGFDATNYGADSDFSEPDKHSAIFSKLYNAKTKKYATLETHHDHKTGKMTHNFHLKEIVEDDLDEARIPAALVMKAKQKFRAAGGINAFLDKHSTEPKSHEAEGDLYGHMKTSRSDYKKAKASGNIAGAKLIKKSMLATIKKHGLDHNKVFHEDELTEEDIAFLMEEPVEYYDALERKRKADWHYKRAGKNKNASLSKGIAHDYEAELLKRGVKTSDGKQKSLIKHKTDEAENMKESLFDKIAFSEELDANEYIQQMEPRMNALVDGLKDEMKKALFNFKEAHNVKGLRNAFDAHSAHTAYHRKKLGDPAKLTPDATEHHKKQIARHEQAKKAAGTLLLKMASSNATNTSQLKKEDVDFTEADEKPGVHSPNWKYDADELKKSLSDFKKRYHPKGFKSGAKEIDKLKKKGK